jgi:hypothetical protein
MNCRVPADGSPASEGTGSGMVCHTAVLPMVVIDLEVYQVECCFPDDVEIKNAALLDSRDHVPGESKISAPYNMATTCYNIYNTTYRPHITAITVSIARRTQTSEPYWDFFKDARRRPCQRETSSNALTNPLTLISTTLAPNLERGTWVPRTSIPA